LIGRLGVATPESPSPLHTSFGVGSSLATVHRLKRQMRRCSSVLRASVRVRSRPRAFDAAPVPTWLTVL